MRRKPLRCPAADSVCTDAERRRRWSQATPTPVDPHTRAAPIPPDRGPQRSRRRCRWQRFRRAGTCTTDRAPSASHTGRNTHTPAAQRRRALPTRWRYAPSSAACDGVRGVDLLGDILERGMTYVLAVHHVDHVLADVLGVIADTLQRPNDPHDFERPANGTRVLHHERDTLTMNGFVLFVHHSVFLRGSERRLRVHARKRVERVMNHLRDLTAEMLDLAILVRGTLHGGELRGDVADFLALIADSLEVGDGFDDGDDDAQVAGRRRPQRQNSAALLVNGHFHAVDLVVVGSHRLAQLAVSLDQGGNGFVQLLFDETAHLQHLITYLLQVFVEAPGDVVGEIGRFHGVYLATTLKPGVASTTRPLHASFTRIRCARTRRAFHLHPITARVNNMHDKCDVMRVPRRAAACAKCVVAESGT